MAVKIGGVVALVCVALWVTGRIYTFRDPVSIVVVDQAVGIACKQAPPIADRAENTVLVLPDLAVLGDRPGQELRRWVLADPTVRLIVPPGKPTSTQIKASRLVVAFGAAGGNSELIGTKVVFVHPYETPPANVSFAKGSVLMLPGIDLARQNSAWRDWAGTQAGMEIKEDAGTALDIRLRWPEVMLPESKQ